MRIIVTASRYEVDVLFNFPNGQHAHRSSVLIDGGTAFVWNSFWCLEVVTSKKRNRSSQ